MAKVTLGKRPKHISHTVTFALPEGGAGDITWQFVYRTRAEFGAFIDQLTADAGVPPPRSAAEEDVQYSLQQSMQAAVDKNAAYLLKIATGWNLDAEFGLEALRQFCDELPGGAMATMEAYRAAMTEGRLGN